MSARGVAWSAEGPRPARAIVLGGLLAGTLDIVAAFTVYGLRGASPVRILQSIASGLLGAAAFRGGAATAALGLLLHFLIALTATAVYYAASRKIGFLVRQPLLAGSLYGVAVYFFMNYVVLPLSAVAKGRFVWSIAATILLVHVVCVGVPIALVVQRYAGPARREASTR